MHHWWCLEMFISFAYIHYTDANIVGRKFTCIVWECVSHISWDISQTYSLTGDLSQGGRSKWFGRLVTGVLSRQEMVQLVEAYKSCYRVLYLQVQVCFYWSIYSPKGTCELLNQGLQTHNLEPHTYPFYSLGWSTPKATSLHTIYT